MISSINEVGCLHLLSFRLFNSFVFMPLRLIFILENGDINTKLIQTTCIIVFKVFCVEPEEHNCNTIKNSILYLLKNIAATPTPPPYFPSQDHAALILVLMKEKSCKMECLFTSTQKQACWGRWGCDTLFSILIFPVCC